MVRSAPRGWCSRRHWSLLAVVVAVAACSWASTPTAQAVVGREHVIKRPGPSAAAWRAVIPDSNDAEAEVAVADLATGSSSTLATPGAFADLGVAVAPNGRTAYVVSAGSAVLQPVSLGPGPVKAQRPISLAGSPPPAHTRVPDYIAISPDGAKAFVSDGLGTNNQVLSLDLRSRPIKVAKAIAVGLDPRGVAFAPNGKTVYVVNFGSGTVTPISVATDTAGPAIKGVGSHPEQIAITPDGRTAYVADNGSSDVYPINLATHLAGAPISVGAGLTPLGIAIAPNGRTAYTANFGPDSNFSGSGDTVTPITLAANPAADVVHAAITVGGGPFSVAVTPDSKTVYATNSNDGTLTPIKAATDTTGATISVSSFPRSLAITPDQAPTARFTTAATGRAGVAVAFDASRSSSPVGSIASYAWTFGDGTSETTASAVVSHVYARAAAYKVSLTMTNTAGTSTQRVFTGQTISNDGGPSARSSREQIIVAAPPVLFKSVDVTVTSGRVRVKLPGRRAFRPFHGGEQIPVGSEVDTSAGQVQVLGATDAHGHTASGSFYAGVFRATQARSGGRVLTLLTLTGSRPQGCASHVAFITRRRRHRARRLWSSTSRGNFRTVGSYASATERGTKWLTEDTCSGTLIRVTRGSVLVQDFPHHRRLVLRAPHSFLARPG